MINISNLHITVLTLFPEMFPGPLSYSLAGQSLKKNIWSIDIINIRDFGLSNYKKIDDKMYGGGNGLVMRPDVLGRALDQVFIKNSKTKIIYPSPRGKLLTQKKLKSLAQEKNLTILCGRFEGIDERIIDEYNVEQISVGDYILSGGEVAAMVVLDSIIRLLPGVVINQDTLAAESFEFEYDGMSLIEHPLYTKPAVWKGRRVPEVLLSGHHDDIKKWKRSNSIRITKAKYDNSLD